jgi:hypothetical protein
MMAIALVCLPLCSGTALAKNGQLRGAKTIAIVIEALKEDAKKCGLDEKSIKVAADFPISFTKLKEDTIGSQDLILYINVNTQAVKNNNGNIFACTSNIDVEVYFYGYVAIPFNDRSAQTHVKLFEESGIFSSNTSRHGDHINDAVEDYLKLFATEFNNDNK